MNSANNGGASRSTAARPAANNSSRSTNNISRETASHNTAARTNNNAGATRNVGNNAPKPKDNAARNVASNTARHDNVAPKETPRNNAPRVNEGARNNNAPRVNEGVRNEAPRGNSKAPAVRNEPPRGNDGIRNNPPRPHDNPPRVHNEPRPPRHPGHNPPPPPRPRPPRGSHFRASVLGTLITIAKINAITNAIHRAERAARLATRYSVVINRNYVPRTYATIVETVNDDLDYYYKDGVFYIIGADGDYYVIEPPIGALVEEIPADYERVVIDDEIFYKVDDTLYKVTIVEGVPYFEVVLNL